MAAPSANRFGKVSPTTSQAVTDELSNYLSEDDLILDGGSSEVGGRLTSSPDSFTNEAVTMKKISIINTTSSIGVISIFDSSSSFRLLPSAIDGAP